MGSEVLIPARRCPFYGHHFSEQLKVLFGQGGNQCGLVTYNHSPCKMEIEGLQVDWNKCPLDNEENAGRFNSMLESAIVMPKDSLTSFSFRDFYYKVMSRS